jgi:hypothetical protein
MTEPNPKTLPRVDGKMLLKDLKVEVVARGQSVKSTPTKKELLHRLGLGSICISRTSEYKYIEKLRQLIQDETQSQIANEKKAMIKAQADKEKIIQDKIILLNKCSQKLHVFIETKIHPCPLAPSQNLIDPQYKESFVNNWNVNDGLAISSNSFESRSKRSHCDVCQKVQCVWTCEKCDFDICQICFDVELLPEPQRKKRRSQLMAEEDKRRMQLDEEQKRARKRYKEETEQRKKEEIKQLEKKLGKFLPHHKDVPKTNKKAQGSGYTVWSANGSHWDGPPYKHFDSSWDSLKDAKQRAKYLFYIKNPWGVEASEVDNELDHKQSEFDEPVPLPSRLFSLQMHDQEGDEWTVAIVPDSAFKFLDNCGEDDDDNDNEGLFHHDNEDSENDDSVCYAL